jgi:hypothetical protein
MQIFLTIGYHNGNSDHNGNKCLVHFLVLSWYFNVFLLLYVFTLPGIVQNKSNQIRKWIFPHEYSLPGILTLFDTRTSACTALIEV